MQVQSLSVCVPGGCPNQCKFCVSHMHRETYFNEIEKNLQLKELYKNDFKARLIFARDNGCNTMILTGNSEPLFNRRFMEDVLEWNANINSPFKWIEVQTSGINIDKDYLKWLRSAGITTINLSLSDMFDYKKNYEYNCTPEKYQVNNFINDTCNLIKKYDFILRLSLNMTDVYNNCTTDEIFQRLEGLKANQVTFRVLYSSQQKTPEDEWISKHKTESKVMHNIYRFINSYGHHLEKLPFGADKYSVNGISTVIDNDCMSTETKETIRYLILRPDCKLYSKWDDKGSILF